MPALVKSSTALGAGGLSLLRQEVRVQSASEIVLDAEYCCLPAYAETWTQRLRIGAPTPLPAPSVISYYNLLSPLALATVSQNTTQGLTYFSCSFSAPRDATTPIDGTNPAPQFETTITSQVQEQSLSGKLSGTYSLPSDEIIRPYSIDFSFLYDSETKTITAADEQLTSEDPTLYINPEELYISQPRFLRLQQTGQPNFSEPPQLYYSAVITRTESRVSSKGSRSYSLSMQKVYRSVQV